MSHDDRGAYTPPSEPPLSFDARQPVRGSSPLPTTLIASVVLLVIVGGAALLLFRNGLQGRDPSAPVGAQIAETRTAPPADAQPNDPTDGLQIYRTDTPAANAAPTFVPPPETPSPRPAPAPAPPPVQIAEAPPAPQPPAAPPAKAPQLQIAVSPRPAPAARPAPAPPPAQIAAPPAPRAPAAAAGGAGTSVQVGAFSSRALAERGWNDAVRVAPGAAVGRGARYETVEAEGRTLYRTFVTGFASREDAQAFCDRLRAANRSCYVR